MENTNTPASAASERRPMLEWKNCPVENISSAYFALLRLNLTAYADGGFLIETTGFRWNETIIEGDGEDGADSFIAAQLAAEDALTAYLLANYPPLAARVKGLEAEVERLKEHRRILWSRMREQERAVEGLRSLSRGLSRENLQPEKLRHLREIEKEIAPTLEEAQEAFARITAAPSGNADSAREGAEERESEMEG